MKLLRLKMYLKSVHRNGNLTGGTSKSEVSDNKNEKAPAEISSGLFVIGEVKKMFDKLFENLRSFAKSMLDFAYGFFNAVSEFLSPVFNNYRRTVHLAFHAKKARVRKKNMRRLSDILYKKVIIWQK